MRAIRPILSAALLAAAFAAPAAAQGQGQGQGPALDQGEWLKICNTDPNANKEVCLVTRELRTPQGQPLASVAIREIEGETDRLLLVSVPVGMMIQPGVQLQVDGAEPVQANYQICFPNACYAEMRVQGDYIEKLKRGRELRLTALNQQAQQVPLPVSLIGFTAAYEGEGLDPTELQARSQQLEQELNRRAAEARERLIEAQREATEGN